MIYIKLLPSTRKNKKYMIAYTQNDKKFKTVHFGQKGSSTYLDHKDITKRTNYIKRHKALGEDWSNPYKAGTLSKYILWGAYSTLDKALKSYANRFKFKISN